MTIRFLLEELAMLVESVDAETTGIFVRIPAHIAAQFPPRNSEDTSPPHFTLLYIGKTTPEQFESIVRAVRVAVHGRGPFYLDMYRYGEFKNEEGQIIPHMVGESDIDLGRLHADLWRAVAAAGVRVDHGYGGPSPGKPEPDRFNMHATLDYLDPGRLYDGPRPVGEWLVRGVEVWRGEDIRKVIPLEA